MKLQPRFPTETAVSQMSFRFIPARYTWCYRSASFDALRRPRGAPAAAPVRCVLGAPDWTPKIAVLGDEIRAASAQGRRRRHHGHGSGARSGQGCLQGRNGSDYAAPGTSGKSNNRRREKAAAAAAAAGRRRRKRRTRLPRPEIVRKHLGPLPSLIGNAVFAGAGDQKHGRYYITTYNKATSPSHMGHAYAVDRTRSPGGTACVLGMFFPDGHGRARPED